MIRGRGRLNGRAKLAAKELAPHDRIRTEGGEARAKDRNLIAAVGVTLGWCDVVQLSVTVHDKGLLFSSIGPGLAIVKR